jgi:hypothetical protein
VNVTVILRQDVAPVGSAYVMFVGMFAWYLRRTGRGRAESGSRSFRAAARHPEWPTLLRFLAGTFAGGYLFFALVILTFYLVLGGQPGNFVSQSLAQGSVLAFGVVLPSFAILTWAEAAWRRRSLK